MTQQGFFTKLENRGRIRVAGAQAKPFLQGLITADINMLGPSYPLLYSCLFTPNGKFLHDFFISADGDALLLDCEGGARAVHLAKILGVYKLRTRVEIETVQDSPVYAVLKSAERLGLPDPRHPDMGYRSFTLPENIPERPFEAWDRHRIERLIPDGSRDMPPERATPLEYGLDRLSAVSYDKGCYLGQELTARMHYRNLGKKALRRVSGGELPPLGTPLLSTGNRLVGEMCSSCGDIGLALVRKDYDGQELIAQTGEARLSLV